MSGILIHDGRRISHRKWATDAISGGHADGVIISPFTTPRVGVPRHPSAFDLAKDISEIRGEVIFDAMTHARLLPGSNKTDFYDGWDLWSGGNPALGNPSEILDHVERVFTRQDQLKSPHLTPTIPLRSPSSGDSELALNIASAGRSLDSATWQSLAGSREFWSSGSALDSFIGSLASLRAPAWVLTVTNDMVLDGVPDLSNVEAFTGLLRSIRSLSLRSRVIIAHADYSGLPAVAAGADTVGTGWDRAQRTFDPLSFHRDSDPGPRIPASYVTQGMLHAVLRREVADAIQRLDPVRAGQIRGGPLPLSDQAERIHHLAQLRAAVLFVNAMSDPAPRVTALRTRYAAAATEFDRLISSLSQIVKAADKSAWCSRPSAVLEAYARDEGY